MTDKRGLKSAAERCGLLPVGLLAGGDPGAEGAVMGWAVAGLGTGLALTAGAPVAALAAWRSARASRVSRS